MINLVQHDKLFIESFCTYAEGLVNRASTFADQEPEQGEIINLLMSCDGLTSRFNYSSIPIEHSLRLKGLIRQLSITASSSWRALQWEPLDDAFDQVAALRDLLSVLQDRMESANTISLSTETSNETSSETSSKALSDEVYDYEDEQAALSLILEDIQTLSLDTLSAVTRNVLSYSAYVTRWSVDPNELDSQRADLTARAEELEELLVELQGVTRALLSVVDEIEALEEIWRVPQLESEPLAITLTQLYQDVLNEAMTVEVNAITQRSNLSLEEQTADLIWRDYAIRAKSIEPVHISVDLSAPFAQGWAADDGSSEHTVSKEVFHKTVSHLPSETEYQITINDHTVEEKEGIVKSLLDVYSDEPLLSDSVQVFSEKDKLTPIEIYSDQIVYDVTGCSTLCVDIEGAPDLNISLVPPSENSTEDQ